MNAILDLYIAIFWPALPRYIWFSDFYCYVLQPISDCNTYCISTFGCSFLPLSCSSSQLHLQTHTSPFLFSDLLAWSISPLSKDPECASITKQLQPHSNVDRHSRVPHPLLRSDPSVIPVLSKPSQLHSEQLSSNQFAQPSATGCLPLASIFWCMDSTYPHRGRCMSSERGESGKWVPTAGGPEGNPCPAKTSLLPAARPTLPYLKGSADLTKKAINTN